jgi:hypothetical protein
VLPVGPVPAVALPRGTDEAENSGRDPFGSLDLGIVSSCGELEPVMSSGPAPTDSGYASRGRPTEPNTCDDATGSDFNEFSADMEDTRTVYSIAQSASEDDMEIYTSLFAEALAEHVACEAEKDTQSARFVPTLGLSLPRLLRAFALRLGCVGSGKAEKEVMYFIHKHRK